ncbi:MAG: hypothetical protein ABIO06_02855 [Pseudolysinimonas sp.]
MTDSAGLFEALLDGVTGAGVVAGAMFGSRAFMLNGKSIGCLKGDVLAFKLGAGTPELAAALALPGAALFDPSAHDRPFKDWVAIPFDHAERAPELLAAAIVRATS